MRPIDIDGFGIHQANDRVVCVKKNDMQACDDLSAKSKPQQLAHLMSVIKSSVVTDAAAIDNRVNFFKDKIVAGEYHPNIDRLIEELVIGLDISAL